MVPAVRGRLSKSAQALRQSCHRHRGFVEIRSADTIAVPFRSFEHAVSRVWLSFVPGALLVESREALHHKFRSVTAVPIPFAFVLPKRPFVGGRIIFPDVLRLRQVTVGEKNPVSGRTVACHPLNPIEVAFADLLAPRKCELHIPVNRPGRPGICRKPRDAYSRFPKAALVVDESATQMTIFENAPGDRRMYNVVDVFQRVAI